MTRFRHILVPHDLSAHANRALRVAADLVAPGGELVVLHAIVPYVPATDLPVADLGAYISSAELLSGARRRLEREVTRVLGKRPTPRITIAVELDEPARCIARRSRGMDLIVIATAGRTGLSHLVIGSVAEKVVRHSPIPVLSLRPETAARLARARHQPTSPRTARRH
jgi:nucleotide-binding universal stress UspA family protein